MGIVNATLAPAQHIVNQWEVWLPPILLAIAIVLIGWIVAKIMRFMTVKALRTVNFHILTERAGLDGFLRQGGTQTDTVGVLASLVSGLVILVALVLALNTVGLTYATGIATRVALFMPRLIVAVVLLTFGLYFSRFVASTVSLYCAGLGLADAGLLGRFAQSGVIVFLILLVLDELHVGQGIIRDTFLIVLGGVMLGLALAFGLGGQKWAAGILERQWPRDASSSPRKTRS